MVSINDLPVEILCMILEDHRQDRKQLKNFSLISRPFLLVCRRYLFTVLRIAEPNPTFNRATRSWRRILKRSPYVRSYIRTLEVGPPIFRMLAKNPSTCSDHWRMVLKSGMPSISSDNMLQIMASTHSAENVTLRFEFQPWSDYSSSFKETITKVVQRRATTTLNLEDSVDFPLDLLSASSSIRNLSLVSVNLSEQTPLLAETAAALTSSALFNDTEREAGVRDGQKGLLESLLLFSSDDAVKQLVHLSKPCTGLDLSGLKRLAVNMTGSDGRNALKLIPRVARSIETLELRLGLDCSGLEPFSLDDFPNVKRLVISQAFNLTDKHPIRKLMPFLSKTEKKSNLEDLQLHLRCETPYANYSCEMTQQDARKLIVSGEWRRLEACLLGNQTSGGDPLQSSTGSDTKYPYLHNIAVVFRPDDVAPFMTPNLESSLNVSLTGLVPRLHKSTNIQISLRNDCFQQYV